MKIREYAISSQRHGRTGKMGQTVMQITSWTILCPENIEKYINTKNDKTWQKGTTCMFWRKFMEVGPTKIWQKPILYPKNTEWWKKDEVNYKQTLLNIIVRKRTFSNLGNTHIW
jgi:hypothetical protein